MEQKGYGGDEENDMTLNHAYANFAEGESSKSNEKGNKVGIELELQLVDSMLHNVQDNCGPTMGQV